MKRAMMATLLVILLAALALPALAAPKNEVPVYQTIYWPFAPPWTGVEQIDTRTGLGTHINYLFAPASPSPGFPDLAYTPFGLAFDVDGTVYTVNSWFDTVLPENSWGRFARIDPTTGDLEFIGPLYNMNFAGPDMDVCGNFYVTGFTVGDPADPSDTPLLFGDSYLYRFDKSTGIGTRVGDTGHSDWMDLAFDSKGRLWATTNNELWRLDPSTGTATFVTRITGVPQSDLPGVCEADWPYMEVMSIAFDANDNLYGTAIRGFSWCTDLNSPVVKIDVKTGRATLIGYTNQSYNHGGDIDLRKVKVCHRKDDGRVVSLIINYDSLADHRAHGDSIPGYPCDCSAALAPVVTGSGQRTTPRPR